jgi:hypothetical protein
MLKVKATFIKEMAPSTKTDERLPSTPVVVYDSRRPFGCNNTVG